MFSGVKLSCKLSWCIPTQILCNRLSCQTFWYSTHASISLHSKIVVWIFIYLWKYSKKYFAKCQSSTSHFNVCSKKSYHILVSILLSSVSIGSRLVYETKDFFKCWIEIRTRKTETMNRTNACVCLITMIWNIFLISPQHFPVVTGQIAVRFSILFF